MGKRGKRYVSVEICAGAGGTALGLEMAGFDHIALVENDAHACATLRANRPKWNIIEEDVNKVNFKQFKNIDLVSGGVPCPPFSHAGKQLGHLDERDLFPAALKLVEETNPKAVMLENVRGLLDPKFADYRKQILTRLEELGYKAEWRLLQAANFGVPQLRPRSILVALKPEYYEYFKWPEPGDYPTVSVGEALYEEMKSNGWKLADEWKVRADKVAPTLVGGSKKHGGADLGPTRAKAAWEKMGVDGKGIADEAPNENFIGNPRLTVRMAATLQGFPKEWKIVGKKTSAYRQVGNAFPAPVAAAVGVAIFQALTMAEVIATSTENDDVTATKPATLLVSSEFPAA